MWHGDYKFVLKNLILKDFRVRYRNMSLGVFWSLLNPLVMMTVLTFVFTKVMPNARANFPVFILSGLIPVSFFQIAFSTGTGAVVENASLIKKVRVPAALFPIAAVLSNCVHFLIQLGLLVVMAIFFHVQITAYWLWIPLILVLELIFACGLVLATSGLNVYIRDTRYVVESANTVLFWLVPIFYDFSIIPHQYADVYQYNPLAALVLAMHQVIFAVKSPAPELMLKALLVSCLSFAFGLFVFSRLRRKFYDHL